MNPLPDLPKPLSLQALMATPQGLFIAPYCPAPGLPLPYFEARIPAGFPSPAADYLEGVNPTLVSPATK